MNPEELDLNELNYSIRHELDHAHRVKTLCEIILALLERVQKAENHLAQNKHS